MSRWICSISFPRKFNDQADLVEKLEWLQANVGGKPAHFSYKFDRKEALFLFEKKSDAVNFKLTWA